MKPEEHDIMRAVEDTYWWYQALREHVVETVDWGLRDFSPPDAVRGRGGLLAALAEKARRAGLAFSLLDAGCGSGGMLAALRRKFAHAELTGIDKSEHAIELCRDRNLGVRLLRAGVHDLPFPAEAFDIVLSLDVWVNAGVDDALAAHETYRVLRPGGQLILNLAAFDFLKGAHDKAVDAVRRYTRPQVRALLEGANFTIERLTYWNFTLTPPIALMRWFSRRRLDREPARSDFRTLPALANSALKALAALELSASRHLSLPFGTSVLAVARKHG
jgi:SAM-dependent methyltransferase